jgi:hypothetical protein
MMEPRVINIYSASSVKERKVILLFYGWNL